MVLISNWQSHIVEQILNYHGHWHWAIGAVLLVAGCLETDVGCDRRNSEDFGRERGQRFSNTWQ